MLAQHRGGLLNAAQFARNLGVDGKTVAHYLDLLVDLMLVRRLPPWACQPGQAAGARAQGLRARQRRAARVAGHRGQGDAALAPGVGASWGTWVAENLLALAPPDAQAFFFRSAAGAEIDLLVERASGERWAIEIKRSLQPKLERGLHAACADVQPTHRWVVYPGAERYRLGDDAWAVGLPELAEGLTTLR